MESPESPDASISSVSPDQYRAVMRHWPSGVTVITMLHDGRRHGMTASAFTSVSVNPPLVLIVVDRRWRSHDYLVAAGSFCVNILAADQSNWSDRFAGRHGEMADRFEGIPTATAAGGAPVLTGALGYLDCTVENAYPAGDHTIFVGRVVSCGIQRGGDPLVFHNTRYTRLDDAQMTT